MVHMRTKPNSLAPKAALSRTPQRSSPRRTTTAASASSGGPRPGLEPQADAGVLVGACIERCLAWGCRWRSRCEMTCSHAFTEGGGAACECMHARGKGSWEGTGARWPRSLSTSSMVSWMHMHHAHAHAHAPRVHVHMAHATHVPVQPRAHATKCAVRVLVHVHLLARPEEAWLEDGGKRQRLDPLLGSE